MIQYQSMPIIGKFSTAVMILLWYLKLIVGILRDDSAQTQTHQIHRNALLYKPISHITYPKLNAMMTSIILVLNTTIKLQVNTF